MKHLYIVIAILISLSSGFFWSESDAAEEQWAIEKGREKIVSSLFDSENASPSPPFSVDSIKIQGGSILVSVLAEGASASIRVNNAVDEACLDCIVHVAVCFCISEVSDAALAAAYIDWLKPRLDSANPADLWSRRQVPRPEAPYGGVTQAYSFMKVFFSLWLGLLAVLLTYLFVRPRRMFLKKLPSLIVFVFSSALLLVLLLALAGVLFGNWPHVS